MAEAKRYAFDVTLDYFAGTLHKQGTFRIFGNDKEIAELDAVSALLEDEPDAKSICVTKVSQSEMSASDGAED